MKHYILIILPFVIASAQCLELAPELVHSTFTHCIQQRDSLVYANGSVTSTAYNTSISRPQCVHNCLIDFPKCQSVRFCRHLRKEQRICEYFDISSVLNSNVAVKTLEFGDQECQLLEFLPDCVNKKLKTLTKNSTDNRNAEQKTEPSVTDFAPKQTITISTPGLSRPPKTTTPSTPKSLKKNIGFVTSAGTQIVPAFFWMKHSQNVRRALQGASYGQDQGVVQSGWADWGQWAACQTGYGNGEPSSQTRSRACLSLTGCNDGVSAETRMCNSPAPAPQNDPWGEWGAFSSCSATCGQGSQIRSRFCPQPGTCPGSGSESQSCQASPCPSWAAWAPWGTCSATCGQGRSQRTRVCGQGSNMCFGQSIETRPCSSGQCAPQWANWGAWSSCDATCGMGHLMRQRSCSQTAGTSGSCLGGGTEMKFCELRTCDVFVEQSSSCNWAVWNEWSQCAPNGSRTRSRLCNCNGGYGQATGTCAGASTDNTQCDAGVQGQGNTGYSRWIRG